MLANVSLTAEICTGKTFFFHVADIVDCVQSVQNALPISIIGVGCLVPITGALHSQFRYFCVWLCFCTGENFRFLAFAKNNRKSINYTLARLGMMTLWKNTIFGVSTRILDWFFSHDFSPHFVTRHGKALTNLQLREISCSQEGTLLAVLHATINAVPRSAGDNICESCIQHGSIDLSMQTIHTIHARYDSFYLSLVVYDPVSCTAKRFRQV